MSLGHYCSFRNYESDTNGLLPQLNVSFPSFGNGYRPSLQHTQASNKLCMMQASFGYLEFCARLQSHFKSWSIYSDLGNGIGGPHILQRASPS